MSAPTSVTLAPAVLVSALTIDDLSTPGGSGSASAIRLGETHNSSQTGNGTSSGDDGFVLHNR